MTFALSMGAYVGESIGLFMAGIIADRIGYKKTLKVWCREMVLLTGLILLSFLQRIKAQILLGISWGTFQTLSVTYASFNSQALSYNVC